MSSRLGEGSTFSFTLPLVLDSDPHAAPVPLDDLRNLRALVVDDNEVNRRVLHEQITSWGMRSDSFAAGEEALEALREAKASGDPYHFDRWNDDRAGSMCLNYLFMALDVGKKNMKKLPVFEICAGLYQL